MIVFQIILLFLGVVVIAATLLSCLPWPYWWIRDLDFPRVQIVFLAFLVLFGYLFINGYTDAFDIIFLAILVGCIAYQLYRIYPYTPVATTQVKRNSIHDDRRQFALMVANVLMDNRNADRLQQLIREVAPDLILMVEVDHWWAAQNESLSENYPYSIVHPLDNTYGMALYSRLELTDSRIGFLIQDDVPSIHTRFTLPCGTKVDLYGVHPRPPSPTEHYRSTERDAELLLIAEKIKDSTRPVVIAGDLNDVAWSRTNRLFQAISGLLDPRIGRGTFGTFPAAFPFLRWPLDHVFHSRQFRLLEMRTLPRFGSDHLPVFIELIYEPSTEDSQEEPEQADHEDREKARDTIEEAREDN